MKRIVKLNQGHGYSREYYQLEYGQYMRLSLATGKYGVQYTYSYSPADKEEVEAAIESVR